MFKFCFNDCFPDSCPNDLLVSSLSKSLLAFDYLMNKFPAEVDGIITTRDFSSMPLNGAGFTLLDCIQALDRPIRTLAFKFFVKYPVEGYYEIPDEDALLTEDFGISVQGVRHNALNAKIVFDNGGVLFTLGFHKDLCFDVLSVTDTKGNVFNVNNLYGAQANTDYIIEIVTKSIKDKEGNFDKLLGIIGPNEYSSRFKKSFESASISVQESIINRFEIAIGRGGITALFADGDTVKDVTPERENKIKVFELRVFDPVPFRIYFYESNDKIYLALAEKKPQDKVQSIQIKSAATIVKSMLIEE